MRPAPFDVTCQQDNDRKGYRTDQIKQVANELPIRGVRTNQAEAETATEAEVESAAATATALKKVTS